ncbi:hypothetical protein BDP81DRAFT_416621 [Colletotrichum phormii]|uniref:Uncharacterized protein n=1 Tax=Colletotrichum phormii TaxID=359342 RepID=A0AAJ0A582_9PEZI|nr:uncharacterized protein BDP81DRAFT_416621 [Colletotrichum phormii]KAK1654820.1 hypothetical protein BDP81DRAFT_416621 [Colletotrichum phormii]
MPAVSPMYFSHLPNIPSFRPSMERRCHPCHLHTPHWPCVFHDNAMLPKGDGNGHALQSVSAIEGPGYRQDTKSQSVHVSFQARQYAIRRQRHSSIHYLALIVVDAVGSGCLHEAVPRPFLFAFHCPCQRFYWARPRPNIQTQSGPDDHCSLSMRRIPRTRACHSTHVLHAAFGYGSSHRLEPPLDC